MSSKTLGHRLSKSSKLFDLNTEKEEVQEGHVLSLESGITVCWGMQSPQRPGGGASQGAGVSMFSLQGCLGHLAFPELFPKVTPICTELFFCTISKKKTDNVSLICHFLNSPILFGRMYSTGPLRVFWQPTPHPTPFFHHPSETDSHCAVPSLVLLGSCCVISMSLKSWVRLKQRCLS